MKDLLPILAHTLVMWAIVLIIVHVLPSLWLQLTVGVAVGAVYYLVGARLMRFEELDEMIALLRRRKDK